MTKAFGTKFQIVNAVQQHFKTKAIDRKWIHHATLVRGFKEYCVFRDMYTNKIYLEEVDAKTPGLFKKIADDQEWQDLHDFCKAAGLLTIASPKTEIAAGPEGLPGFNFVKG